MMKKKLVLTLAALAMCLVSLTSPTTAADPTAFDAPLAVTADPKLSATQIYRNTVTATVLIFSESGSGSGFILDRTKGRVITNAHVVGKDATVQVVFPLFDKEGKLVVERQGYRSARLISARV